MRRNVEQLERRLARIEEKRPAGPLWPETIIVCFADPGGKESGRLIVDTKAGTLTWDPPELATADRTMIGITGEGEVSEAGDFSKLSDESLDELEAAISAPGPKP